MLCVSGIAGLGKGSAYLASLLDLGRIAVMEPEVKLPRLCIIVTGLDSSLKISVLTFVRDTFDPVGYLKELMVGRIALGLVKIAVV